MLDLGVFLDPLHPFDNGHRLALEAMARQCRHLLVIILGANRPRSVQRPFTLAQRYEMVDRITEADGHDLAVTGLDDVPGDDPAWARGIVRAIRMRLDRLGIDFDRAEVGLGCFRGRGHIAGLREIPEHWRWLDLGTAPIEIDGAHLRADYLRNGTFYGTRCPEPVVRILDWFCGSQEYRSLARDAEAVARLQARYGTGPFRAADAVILHRDSVLSIARGARPNRNARAYPGGLVEPGETPLEAAKRELGEEIAFSGSFSNADIAGLQPVAALEVDDPTRDPRGHWITTAHLFRLPDALPPPDVRARSDARRARFVGIAEIEPERWWADHGFLLPQLLKIEKTP